MKRTITTKVFAIASPYSRLTPEDLRSGDVGANLLYSTTDMSSMDGYIVVGEGTVTVELRSANDVAANQVAVLRSQIKAVQADAQSKVSQLEDQIRNLTALTYEPADEVPCDVIA
jgi:hypothetical protein